MTVFGRFQGNKIFSENGEEIPCITYKIVRENIEGKKGFFNLEKIGHITDWVIYQYVLVD